MRKLLFILALAILPALTFAQGAGGQIKRPVKKQQTTSTTPAKKKQPAKEAPANVPPKAPPIVSQTIRQFFPVWGITLNETTIKQAKSMGFKIETYDDGSKSIYSQGISFRDDDKDGYFDHLFGYNFNFEFPEEWKSKGFSWDNSYDRWIQVFKDLGFSMTIERELKVEEFQGRKTLSAMVIATSLDNTLEFVLGFCCGENGYQTSSPRTLSSIAVRAN